MKEFVCEECGSKVNYNDKKCPKCGAEFELIEKDIEKSNTSNDNLNKNQIVNNQTSPFVFCTKCGTKLFNIDSFCSNCGKTMINRIPNINRNIISLLSFSSTIIVISILALTICVFFGVAIYCNEEVKTGMGFTIIFYGVIISLIGTIASRLFEWMAYMLYTNTKRSNEK